MKWMFRLWMMLVVGMMAAQAGPVPTEEFVNRAGWKNLKTDFGAKGDGKADDTAAFQRGLDALPLHGQGKADDARVLFLPAGTYRITATLQFTNRMAIVLLGEHPERTRVVYDGPAGAAVHCNGVSYSKFGRITWDGSGKAKVAVAHQWDPVARTGPAVTYIEHADEVFQDVGKGLIMGRVVPVLDKDGKIVGYDHGMDAETLIKRCQFIRCSDVGLSMRVSTRWISGHGIASLSTARSARPTAHWASMVADISTSTGQFFVTQRWLTSAPVIAVTSGSGSTPRLVRAGSSRRPVRLATVRITTIAGGVMRTPTVQKCRSCIIASSIRKIQRRSGSISTGRWF